MGLTGISGKLKGADFRIVEQVQFTAVQSLRMRERACG